MAKKNSSVVILLVGVALVLAAAAFYFSQTDKDETLATDTVITQEEDVVTVEETETIKVVEIDVDTALSERILGNPAAPIKISEHSSFTCGHCGSFHERTFKTFKENWIDTGKAYLVFSDFPLNAPALHASMIARCLPEDQYFDFVQMLFEQQSAWAYDVNYMAYLKERAAEAGLNADGFKACLNNKDLQEGILARVRASQSQWEISSTPSFVINNETVVTGSLSYGDFDQSIREAVGMEIEPADPPPSQQPDQEPVPPSDAEDNPQ